MERMKALCYGRAFFCLLITEGLCYNSSGKYQIQSGKRAVLSKAELL